VGRDLFKIIATLIFNSDEFIEKYRIRQAKNCAAEAVFCYTAENSHHLDAYVISKNPLFKEEKISVRRMARCQVTSEKSSNNYISLFCGKPARGLPTPPPTSPRAITHGGRQVQDLLARITRGGGGRVG
jgi:hypothetical protein